MKELEEKILVEGKIFPGNVLKVSSFLNHRIDAPFVFKMGAEIARLYEGTPVDVILTIEASGIAIAMAAAYYFNVPIVFAKKSKTSNVSGDNYTTKVHSYTHNKDFDVIVSRDLIKEGDNVLIVDDFLANGEAVRGLVDIVNQAKAVPQGAAIAIEKGFQQGGDMLRASGLRVESLAIVEEMNENGIKFRN